FAIALGINIPTGKDSLSMKQKYPDGEIIAPGTVIISAGGHCSDIKKVVEPVLKPNAGSLYYINLSEDQFKLGGSSFGQIIKTIGSQAPTVTNPEGFKAAFNTLQELIKNDKIAAGHDIGSGGLITTLLEMCFSNTDLGAQLNLSLLGEEDSIKVLFSENTGVVIQAKDDTAVETAFKNNGVKAHKIGKAVEGDRLQILNNQDSFSFSVSQLRDVWFKTSYLLHQKQTKNDLATQRYNNYKVQPLRYEFPKHFTGKLESVSGNRPKAAILREKGSNSEREMAHAMYLAGFDVKDVHMTDLISGRETLEDIQFIGSVGGFSNSDVLGSAKGWAGAFLYNEKANQALKKFFKRPDTLSVGICNGCQLWMELGLVYPDHEQKPQMHPNKSGKHESIFTSVTIQENNSVMLKSLAGSTLGIWVSHGEGRFTLPYPEDRYNIVAKYGYQEYPANPNGSDYNTAMMVSDDGRHLVTMPHFERSIFQWNWANYPENRNDEVSPWLEAFINA